jgi:hypothetical protein
MGESSMSKRVLIAATAIAAVLLGACSAPISQSQPSESQAPSVELGRHLVAVASCGECHTPFKLGPHGPEPDMTRLLSGHPADVVVDRPPQLGDGPWVWAGTATNTAYAGPWGITYSPNLTPDQNTGLGIWTEEMFLGAIRTGKHMGQSRPIQPPMPWQAYSVMTDHELKSIYAYLRTIPPIENLVPDYRPPEDIASAEAGSAP